MSYDYTCDAQLDDCEIGGDVPGLAGQFRETPWLDEPFGARMQERGYELSDTVTICPTCARQLLSDN